MIFYGIQKHTLLDYPKHLAAILFTGGCNLRCPFCQNRDLVLTPQAIPSPMSEEELYAFLRKRAGILEGIVITGGEPCLHRELPEEIEKIRSLGYKIKLDTNGTRPDMLETLLAQGLLDYIAMDIKAGRDNYAAVSGLPDTAAPELLDKIQTSIRLIRDSGLNYEFRTTAVKGLHTGKDFEDIASWLPDVRHYYLQSFRDCETVLLPDHSFSAFSPEELKGFLSILKTSIPSAAMRGVDLPV